MFPLRKRFILWAIGLCFLMIPSGWASAEEGVTDHEIVIGTIQALTGDMAFIGNQNTNGTKIMINEINKKGGILGRKIRQVVMDDGYVTPRHIANVRRMITEDKVFCFVFNLGTHTVAASLPLLNQYKVPLFSAASNSKLFDNEPFVFTEGASYRQMTIQAIKFMTEKRNHKKVAVFYWDNPLGQEHVEAAKEYFKAVGGELAAEEKFKVEDYDMSSQAARLKNSGATCVIIAASPGGGTKILRAMHNIGYNPEAVGVLMLTSPGFINVAGKDAEGLFLMLPFLEMTNPSLAPWGNLAKQYYPDKPFDSNMVAGMGSVYVFAEACRRAGQDLTREKFIKAVESINYQNFDLPHYKGATDYHFGPNRHRSTSATRIGRIANGQAGSFTEGWLEWKGIPLPEVIGK
ncbi:MAG TPA: ABC transporter substrate-binding protein [Thermodesulfobacteriota bacterium]|nr:ABC transporter substrate-binding protein [Thermodesulfobacteriota bacterium]